MLPELNLDSDSFENLIQEYRSQIAGIYPDWTDYNYHDPGITFLELFVWMQENQQYSMEQLGEAHFSRFFRLAGVLPRKREPARLLCEAAVTETDHEVEIPAGTLFMSGGLPFETVMPERIPAAWFRHMKRLDPDGNVGYVADKLLSGTSGEPGFAPFGSVPVPGSSMVLDIEGRLDPHREYCLSVTIEEQNRRPLTDPAFTPLAELSWEYRTAAGWQPLTILNDETAGLLYSGRIRFCLGHGALVESGEPEFRVVFKGGEFDQPPRIRSVSLCEIELRQTRTKREPEGILLASGTGFPDQEYPLPSGLFLADSVELVADDILEPEKTVPWQRTEELFEAGPEDRVFIADEQAGTVRFGDGIHGLPPEGRILLMSYAETAGAAGNVKSGSVFYAEDPVLRAEGIPFLRMTRMISAGRDPEKTEETLLRIIKDENRFRRAVTCRDYEELAGEVPGLIVHSAHAWVEEDSPRTVQMVVRPGNGERLQQLSEPIRKNILAFLEERRILGTSVRLCSPEYIRTNIILEAVPEPQYRNCRELIEEELRRYFAERETLYGVPLEPGLLYGRLDRLPCIRRITALQVEPARTGVRRNNNGGLIPPEYGVFLPGRMEIILNHYGE